jgi:hypothetical protein
MTDPEQFLDMSGICFRLRSFDFDRSAKGFLEHVKSDHNMWNYLFFMMHIRKKKKAEWDSVEAYFDEKVCWLMTSIDLILE